MVMVVSAQVLHVLANKIKKLIFFFFTLDLDGFKMRSVDLIKKLNPHQSPQGVDLIFLLNPHFVWI